MLWTFLVVIVAWALVSVPAALLLGRLMGLGSGSDRLEPDLIEPRHDDQLSKVA